MVSSLQQLCCCPPRLEAAGLRVRGTAVEQSSRNDSGASKAPLSLLGGPLPLKMPELILSLQRWMK